MRIAQQILRTTLTDRVRYESCPGTDITLELITDSDVEKIIVSTRNDDGPANEAHIRPFSELVQIRQASMITNGSAIDCLQRQLKRHRVQLLGYLIRDLGWAYPVELEFKCCLADLDESQVRYVREPSLETPLVMAGYENSFRGEQKAKIIVNLAKCEFHGESQQSDCPHGPESCFCGLDIILDGLMEELCQKKPKLSKQQDRWVNAAKRKLYNKHQHEFNFGQRTQTPAGNSSQAAGPQVVCSSDSEEQQISRLLDCWTSGDFSGLTQSEKQAIHLAELVDSRRAQAISVDDAQEAWLGDKMNDCYVAVQGVLDNLSPKELDGVRCERLSAKGLSAGRGRAAAERVEAQVGHAAKPSLKQLRELLAQSLRHVKLPHKDCTVLQSIHQGIANVKKRRREEESHAGAPRRKDAPARPVGRHRERRPQERAQWQEHRPRRISQPDSWQPQQWRPALRRRAQTAMVLSSAETREIRSYEWRD
ncbi:unnamed protein product [Effrenium voratum]|nr:unnamed protein product [Effrenium voratum]